MLLFNISAFCLHCKLGMRGTKCIKGKSTIMTKIFTTCLMAAVFYMFSAESSLGGMPAKWKLCKVPAIQSCFYKVSVLECYILNMYRCMITCIVMTESCLHLNWEERNNYHSHCFSCALIGWEVHVPDKKKTINYCITRSWAGYEPLISQSNLRIKYILKNIYSHWLVRKLHFYRNMVHAFYFLIDTIQCNTGLYMMRR